MIRHQLTEHLGSTAVQHLIEILFLELALETDLVEAISPPECPSIENIRMGLRRNWPVLLIQERRVSVLMVVARVTLGASVSSTVFAKDTLALAGLLLLVPSLSTHLGQTPNSKRRYC